MAFVVSIVDTEAADSSHRVETEPDSTLGNLRGLICSMPLPSVERSFTDPMRTHVAICHDGQLLGDESDDATLLALGVIEAPVVVVLLLRKQEKNRKMIAQQN